jgi:hypothetical protein
MSVYNEELRGFGPLRAPQMYPKRLPSVETNENNEILIMDKIKRATRSGVRSNADFAIKRTRMRSMRVRLQKHHSAVYVQT